jgi:bifunctional DNA-binding transcriptional regulator/antitoxin component of YhaV-PrlF toxin-antitoxin module
MATTPYLPSKTFRTRLAAAGRLVIPVELRKQMKLQEGQELLVCGEGNEIRVMTQDEAIRQAQEFCSNLVPPDVLLSEELIADRRAEAKREEDE